MAADVRKGMPSTHLDRAEFERQASRMTGLQVRVAGPIDARLLPTPSLNLSRITSGCDANNYCPDTSVNRAQMAVFLERGMRGYTYTPPPATGTVFGDVGQADFAAAFIEQLAADGITSGCGGGNYCPNDSVTRASMAVFLLRAKYGSSYTPPASSCTTFADVPPGSFACAWIEQMVVEGITSGCGGGNFCPNNPVTRAQMAVFLIRTFDLPAP